MNKSAAVFDHVARAPEASRTARPFPRTPRRAAAAKAALGSVYVDIADLAGLNAESDDAVASGFAAKASINPGQMPAIGESFTPDPGEVEQAQRMLAAAEQSGGVFAFEGRMVDEPVLSLRSNCPPTTWSRKALPTQNFPSQRGDGFPRYQERTHAAQRIFPPR